MKRALFVTAIVGVAALSVTVPEHVGLAAGPAATASARQPPAPPPPPEAASLAQFMDGFHWGLTSDQVNHMYTDTGGIIWKDYDELLAKTRVGPSMTNVENDRASATSAFTRSLVVFGAVPTGYDATGIGKGEYGYHDPHVDQNRESIMSIYRQGKRRYLFFANDHLWKILDEYQLGDSGPYGKTFLEGVNILNAKLGVAGRVRGADPAQDIYHTTADWKDVLSHLRAIDRSSERIFALAIEDNATLNSLPTIRSHKIVDPMELDPSVAAAAGGRNRFDPNAARPAASASSSAGRHSSPPPRR